MLDAINEETLRMSVSNGTRKSRFDNGLVGTKPNGSGLKPNLLVIFLSRKFSNILVG